MASPPVMVTRDWIIAGVVCAGVVALRWLTLDFDNDYFMHLAWAAQIRLGELPIRDFVEPGFALQTLISYALMTPGGPVLTAEGLVAATFIGAGAGCTYAVCRRLALPRAVSIIATIVAVLTYPRLYAYPKAFVYPFALLAIAVYVETPRLRTLGLVALATSVAFLFRHDHGVLVALPSIVAIWLIPGGARRPSLKPLLTYAAMTALLTLPWTAWVAVSGESGQYLRTLAQQSSSAVTGWRIPDRDLRIERGAPLLTIAPAPYPKIRIRWSPGTTDAQRREREARYQLRADATEGTYLLQDFSAGNVDRLLRDAMIEDTQGIDRRTAQVPSGAMTWAVHRLAWWVPLFRVRILPGVLSAANALPWLTDVTFAVPWVLIAITATRAIGRRAEPLTPATVTIVAATLMALVCYQRLVRGSPDSRLADVASLTAILTASMAAAAWRIPGTVRPFARVAIAVFVLTTAAAAIAYGAVPGRLDAAGVDGPTNAARRAIDVFARYRQRPLDVFAPAGATGLPRLARWLNECTRPQQRIAVLGFEPQLTVWAERGFAGGLAFVDAGWMSDRRDQRLALQRWRNQDVPFVVLMTTEAVAFGRDYRDLDAWVKQRYIPVQTSSFGGNKEVTVLIERDVEPSTVHRQTGLPCLVQTSPAATTRLAARPSPDNDAARTPQ